MAFFLKRLVVAAKNDHNIVFLRKAPIFSLKIAENCDYNIYPCLQSTYKCRYVHKNHHFCENKVILVTHRISMSNMDQFFDFCT
jgi:hypothetical protein